MAPKPTNPKPLKPTPQQPPGKKPLPLASSTTSDGSSPTLDVVSPPTPNTTSPPRQTSNEPPQRAQKPSKDIPAATTNGALQPPPTTVRVPPFLMIRELKPTLEDWTLLATVVARGPVRTWSNLATSGTLEEVFLVDREGGFIRATIFNEAISRFEAALRPGTVCTLAGGQIKYKRTAERTSTEHELTFGASATVLVSDESFDVFLGRTCTPVASIASFKDKSFVNVVGILAKCGPVKTFVSNSRKSMVKRELLIVDETNTKLVCTVWGATARDDLEADEGKPCALIDALVSVFNNLRTLSIGAGSAILVDPHLPRATELQSWYDTGVDFSTFSHINAA